MNIEYMGECEDCNCETESAQTPEAVIFWALSNGWMLLYDMLICPACAKDNYNPDSIFGRPNANMEDES